MPRWNKKVLRPRDLQQFANDLVASMRPGRPDLEQERRIAAALARFDLEERKQLPYYLGGLGPRPGRPAKYPWRTMAVDDTFISAANLKSTAAFCRVQGHKTGRKFQCLSTPEGVVVRRVS